MGKGITSVLNENPVVTIVVVAVIAGGAVWMGVRSRSSAPTGGDQAYFTADEGQTYFADKIGTVTPYTKDGKEVVRAYVGKCKDGKPFVAYLSRQNPNAGADMSANANQGPSSMMTREYKRPGDKEWEVFGRMSPASKTRMFFACPDGSKPEPVEP